MARGKKRNPKCMRGRSRGYVLKSLSSNILLPLRCCRKKDRQFVVIDDPIHDRNHPDPETYVKWRQFLESIGVDMKLSKPIFSDDWFKDMAIKGEIKLEKPPEFISLSHAP